MTASAAVILAGVAFADVVELESDNVVTAGGFGAAIAGAVDLDDDGHGDVLVGAARETVDGLDGAGRVYVYSGAPKSAVRTHVSPGAEEEGRFGAAIVGLGDLDDDGAGDYAIGAPGEAGGAGRVYVYSGATGDLLHPIDAPRGASGFGGALGAVPDADEDGVVDLVIGLDTTTPHVGPAVLVSGVDGTTLRVIPAPNEQDTHFAAAVAGVEDLDGDGRGDVIVGAPGSTVDGASAPGRAYVISSATGAVVHAFSSPSGAADGRFGAAVSSVPDVDGNAVSEILVGAPGETSRGGPTGAGRAHLFSGSGAVIRSFDSATPEADGAFGAAVVGATDLDGDGAGDCVIGAPAEDGSSLDAGRVHVFSGATGAVNVSRSSPNATDAGHYGAAVAAAPDTNADGRADVLSGAPGESAGLAAAGRAYVYRELPNDGCSIDSPPLLITVGTTPFSNIGADTTAPFDLLCDFFHIAQIFSDVWFEIVAPCDGEMVVTTCGTADFDTKLGVYGACAYEGDDGSCTYSNMLACNDDFDGCAGNTSRVVVPVVKGECYRIRVGSYSDFFQGTGVLTVECGAACPGDLDGDGLVDGADLGIVLGAWNSVDSSADLTGDGVVDGADLGVLLGDWGPCS